MDRCRRSRPAEVHAANHRVRQVRRSTRSGAVLRQRDRKASKNRRDAGEGKAVVVSNVFTRNSEISVYVALGYPTKIIEATGRWNNVHNVPEDQIQIMRDRWELLADTIR